MPGVYAFIRPSLMLIPKQGVCYHTARRPGSYTVTVPKQKADAAYMAIRGRIRPGTADYFMLSREGWAMYVIDLIKNKDDSPGSDGSRRAPDSNVDETVEHTSVLSKDLVSPERLE